MSGLEQTVLEHRRVIVRLLRERDALLEALHLIASTDPVDAALDPQRTIRVARAAIDEVENSVERATE